jgi:predicted small secreted protein
MRKLLMTCSTVFAALVLSACNTVAGAGEDIQSVAEEANEEI